MAADPSASTKGLSAGRTAPRLERLVQSAGRLIFWERLWRALIAPLCVVGLFFAYSFLGGWDRIEPHLRPLGLIVFALLMLIAIYPLFWLRGAARTESLARVDRDGGLAHRPATAVDDQMALGADPTSAELWALHQRRAAEALEKIRLAPPTPNVARRDPWAMRAAVLLFACVSALIAGSDWSGRLGAAFAWKAPPAVETLARLDGWIDPPAYTRVPPIMLDLSGANASRTVKTPLGSVLVVRPNGASDITFDPTGDLAEVKEEVDEIDADKPKPAVAKEPTERRWKLGAKPATMTIRRGLSTLARIALEPIPDRPPTIALVESPQRGARGVFTLTFKTDDDYGVVSAEAEFGPPPAKPGAKPPRPLVEPPKSALSLPAQPGGIGESKAVIDLSTHPFAGARVSLTLTAKDEADQFGRSEATMVTLPARPFTKPLAKALVEQRRDLSIDANSAPLVLEAIYALMIAPDRFTPEPAHFLGLKIIASRLKAARDDDQLRDVADLIWEMAIRIEEGDLTQIERDLRAAEEALRQALENNASPEELRKLTEELRAAMDRFMRELAEQMRRDQRQDQAERSPNDPNQRNLRQNDMRSLMERMDEAMRRGDREEARRLLEELQNMLDGLRTARPQQPMSPQAREMMRSIEELERMIREQQGLRDETFRDGQQRRQQAERNRQRQREGARQRQPGQQGERQPGQQGRRQPGQQGEQGDDDQDGEDGQQGKPRQGQGDRGGQDEKSLAERQKQLRQQLEAMKRRMQENGMRGEQGLDDAEDAMRQAEGALGNGQEGDAVDAQGRALDAMRRGAQGLAQQMQPGQGGNEFGEGEPGEGIDDQGRPFGPRNRAAEREDPLGRPNRTRDWQDHRGHVPKAGETPLQRAQRVMEELRRRLSDPSRKLEELEYLRRLLTPY